MPYDPNQPMSESNHGDDTRIINGQPYVRQPDTKAVEAFNYRGPASGYDTLEDAQAADEENAQWVPASFKNPGGTLFGPKWMLPAMLAGPALASGLGVGAGAEGVASGAGGAEAALPASLPVTSSAAIPSVGTTVGLGAAPAAAAGTLGGAAAALPAITPAATEASAALPASLPVTSSAAIPATGAATVPLGAAPAAGTTMGTLAKAAPLLKTAGSAIGSATTQAAKNRETESDYGLRAYQAGTNAQSEIANALIARANLEGGQRKSDLANIYRQSVAHNPGQSPYDLKGPPAISQQYLDAIDALAKQGGTELAQDPMYRARTMPAIQPYTPPPEFKKKGTLETAGNWLGPTLTLASSYLGGK